MKYGFIATHEGQFQIRRMCCTLGVKRSGYYAWRKRTPSPREQENQQLVEQIKKEHHKSRQTYGSPRIHAALQRTGITCGRHRVARLMRQNGIVALRSPKRRPVTTKRHAGALAAPNLLRQDFSASGPNLKWVSDITYINTQEGWLYLASVLDLYSRMVVGWAMADHMGTSLVDDALHMALSRRHPGPGLIHHSDQGSQYTSYAYQQRLLDYHCLASMSGVGNCYDNATAESFFGTLKTECAAVPFADRTQARSAIFEYIEVWYNRQRLHSSLGYKSPMEFELYSRH